MTLDTSKPRRQIALVIVLFIHGLVFLGGFCALGVGATIAALSPTSEQNRLHRAPSGAEVAAGEIWFSGHIEELQPGFTDAGIARQSDPWNGCSIRRQSYRSGKNAGWYDEGSIYSYGSALVVSDEPATQGRRVEVPLNSLGPGARSYPSDAEVTAMMPNAAVGGASYRWVKDCFSPTWEVSVDGRSADGVLVPVRDRVAARLETRAARVERLHSEAMWCSLGPLAYAGGLACIALFVSVLRVPGHLPSMFGPAFGKSLPGSSLAFAMPLVGLGLGVLSRVSLFQSAIPLVVYVVAFSAFGLLIHVQAKAFALRRRLAALLGGVEAFGVGAAWGRVALTDKPDLDDMRGRHPVERAVTATEVFVLGNKGALGNKVHTHVAPDPFFVRNGEVVSTCDGSSCNFYGPATQRNEGGVDVRQSAYGAPSLWNNRYAVRITSLTQGDEVVVVGPSASGMDSRAPAADQREGYRESGTARFFRRDQDARVIVFRGTRDDLRVYLARDLGTLQFYRVLMTLWFLAALFSVALAAKYTLLP